MNHLALAKKPTFKRVVAAMTVVFFAVTGVVGTVAANDGSTERLVTFHDRGIEKVILTRADTVGEALEDADIHLDHNDLVEPVASQKLTEKSSTANIYRARPVIVVDGATRQKVMTAGQTPETIAKDAGINLVDEDITKITPTDNVIENGASLEMSVDRATAFNLTVYGKKTVAYTHELTVGDMLKSKDITPGKDDTISVAATAPIQPGMTVEIWRNGLQTVTEEQDVAFATQRIEDATKDTSFKQINTPGEKGRRSVTYQIEMRNGIEVSRKEVASHVLKAPKNEIMTVGTKPSFSGDFAAALAKLRSCEGGYTSVNPAGYYGAYQFTQSAWNSNAPAGWSGVNPTKAPPEVQDQAARNYYVKSGWRPWPSCGKNLPDIYR